LVAVLALGLLAVHFFVNPNDFKPRIVKAVKEATGRDLALPGEIKLSVFPAIALELGPASLGNPPGFATRPFVAVEHLDLHVKLLPLLHKELRVGRVEIEGLDLRLEKNPAGKGNWEDFGGKGAAASAPTSPGGSLGDVGGVLVKNSRVSYGDLAADQLNLEVGRIAAGTSTAIKAKLTLRSALNAPPIGLSGSFEVTPDPAHQQYHLAKLDLVATRAGAAGAAPVTYKVSVPRLDLDVAGETLSAPTFSAQVADAHLSGAVRGSRIMTAPQVGGTFKLDPVSPRDLLGHLGVVIPRTRDPQAFTKLLASGAYRYGGNAVEARDLDVRLDDSTLRGNVSIGNLDTKAMAFDLALDQMDFDRYRPPPVAPPATKVREKPTSLPTETLRSLRASGKLSAGRATVVGVKLTEIAVTLAAKDGVIHLAPAKARLYGGTYAGDITLDGRADVPLMKLEQSMTNIDAAQLLKDFAKSDRARQGAATSEQPHRARCRQRCCWAPWSGTWRPILRMGRSRALICGSRSIARSR
jgi:AsmA protein